MQLLKEKNLKHLSWSTLYTKLTNKNAIRIVCSHPNILIRDASNRRVHLLTICSHEHEVRDYHSHNHMCHCNTLKYKLSK